MEMTATTRIISATAVATEMDGFIMATEPPVQAGGSGKYPPATRLVVAALLNCSFSAVKAFCESRSLSTEGLEMTFTGQNEDGIYTNMTFSLKLPADYPEKFEGTLEKILATCAVKKIMKNLPDIELDYTRACAPKKNGEGV